MYGNYFKFEELVSTQTGLPNSVPSPAHLANLARLWYALNLLREEFGAPIYINSAFRTKEVNESVGGSPRSFHMRGRAADIRPESKFQLEQLWSVVCSYDKQYGLSEKIKYDTFIHIAI